jgi:hypothetical protein
VLEATMLAEPLVTVFVTIYLAVVALGHVLLVSALFSRAGRVDELNAPSIARHTRLNACDGHAAATDGRLAA